ncbi:MAG: 50S ribosomal protein L24 [Candidatus Azosocius agrarius]|nr:MAG: 50S ribosomal protein L24 [Gammaproteobacteria bacterium]
MLKIKKGDKVIVNVGNDIGKKGVVLKIFKIKTTKSSLDNSYSVLIEGINMHKKHIKGNPSKEQVAGIIEREFPINYSNISIINNVTGKRDKIVFKFLENGKKFRVYKSTNEAVKNG